MRINSLLLHLAIYAALLSSCASPAAINTSTPEPTHAMATRTPFLPVSETPSPPSATPSITPSITETPTLADTATVTDTATPTPTGTPTPSLLVNLAAVGDIMLARSVGDQVHARGPEIVFAGVQSALDSADLLVGNLECALTSGGDPQPKSFTFAASPETAKSLGFAGFDVLSLANNHAMDFGIPGLLDTLDNLKKSGISGLGAGRNASEAHAPVILERNGLRVAFLAYADVPVETTGFDVRSWMATSSQPGIAWADLNLITSDVIAAKKQADVVVVLLHAGYEVNAYVPPVSANQRKEAYAAIDAGASLVIGSHSHILEAIEKYHGGLIAFSLGNFVFDNYLGIANSTIILHVVLTPAGVQSYNWIPVLIENGLPRLAAKYEVPSIATLVAPVTP